LSTTSLKSFDDVSPAEQASAELVARALASALGDSSVRTEVNAALATSTIREHKLHFASFMQGRGGHILDAAARRAGVDRVRFQQAVNQMRDVEFYMPVAAHRQQWTGDANVLVGVSVNKEQVPVAFSVEGKRQVLDRHTPPATPLLILTYVETDFRGQIGLNLQGKAPMRCHMNSGEPFEAAATRCATLGHALLLPSSSRAPSAAPSLGLLANATLASRQTTGAAARMAPVIRADYASDPSYIGLYGSFFRVLDAKEYYWQGDPELEVHVTGKRNGPNGTPIDYQCSGEHANDYGAAQPGIRDYSYVYDQNGGFWNGDVRILSAAQIDSLQAAEPAGFQITIWEDDDTACSIRQNNNSFYQNAMAAAAAVGRGINATRTANLLVLAAAVNDLVSLLNGGDDYVGALVSIDSSSYAGQYPGTTHVIILDDGSLNGRATFYMKKTARAVYVGGSYQVEDGSTNMWSASTSGTSGSITYSFYVDDVLQQSGSSNTFYYTAYGSPSSFYLDVKATDSNGVLENGEQVNVVPQGCGTQILC
jgi:hypothetical protein